MWTGLVTHPACLEHLPPPGHPESADRLRAVLRHLETAAFQDLVRVEAPRADETALLRVHGREHVQAITGTFTANAEYVHIDTDTVMSAGSVEAALRAAGAVCAAVDGIYSGRLRNAFCAVRPPGHHAERSRAMGFCLFNNVAVGALYAREVRGYRRLAIVDFDVHHGNGSQDIFFADENAFYASTHQWPLYPGTGRACECGVAGNIVNVPLAAGTGSCEFRAAYEREILPALRRFAPDFIFISAGFDGHRDDPLGGLRLEVDDFAWIASAVCDVARTCCDGRVVSILEGGYDLGALARSAGAHVRALMEA